MQLGMTRRNIGRLLLVAWAVSLAWLARREFSQGEQAETRERTTRLAPSAQYFSVLAGGRQIGQLNVTVDTLVDGVQLSELLVLDVPDGSGTHGLARSTKYSLSRSLRLRQVSTTVFGIGPQERLDGNVGADSVLRLVAQEAPLGGAGRTDVRIAPEAILPAMLPYRVVFGGRLQVGAAFALPLVDLEEGTTRELAVRVTAESTFVVPDSAVWDSAGAEWVAATTVRVPAWRIEHDATGAPTVAWVDAGGGLVRQEIAGGVTIMRSAFEMVRNNYRDRRRGENSAWRRGVPGMMQLIAAGRTPDPAVSQRRFVVSGDSAGGHWPGTGAVPGGRQRLEGDTVTIARMPHPDSAAAVPAGMLESTWLVPSGDPAVRSAAASAVAGATSRADSAAKLTRWVARQIATDTGATGSSAARFTLKARRGTPDGKARLLAAMARASGIPARPVTGLAVLPEGSFGHAWVELWLGGWSAADPTFGQFPAATSLVRLQIGGSSRAVDLALLAGSARFLPIRTPR